MIRKYMFLVCMLYLSFTSLYAKEKIVEIKMGDYSKASDGKSIATYKIVTGSDGIIKSITVNNRPDFKPPEIVRDGNRITLSEGVLTDIIWERNIVYIRGGKGSIYTKNDAYRKVTVNPRPGVLYEHEELRLDKLSDKSVEEVFRNNPSNFSALVYKDNTLYDDYKFKGNTDFKYEFKRKGNIISVTYYYDDTKYSPDIEISGDNIYSFDMPVNVINYYILTGFGILPPFLFPILFLENPFKDVAGK